MSSTKPAKVVRRTCISFAVLAEADAIITHGHTEYRRPRSICSLHLRSQESPVRPARSRFVALETDAKSRYGKGNEGAKDDSNCRPSPFPSALNVRACLESPIHTGEYPLKLHYLES